MSSFLGVPVDAAYHLVSGLTGILTPVLGGLAAVAAIVVFTMAVRLLLMPLSLRALRGQAAQARPEQGTVREVEEVGAVDVEDSLKRQHEVLRNLVYRGGLRR